MKRLLYLVVCVFFTHTTLAQTLTGKVVDEENQPLPYVSIITPSTNTYTNVDGTYEISISENNTKVTFKYIGYQDYSVESSGGVLDVKMVPSSVMIQDVEIIAKKDNGSESVLVIERKKLTGVETSIGSNEMSKKGISTAEDGLKKVTGITFSGGRLNIRGLDDRYNQVTLNGVPLPSNNTDRKNLDLSLLPLGVMDNMKVKKTYSSEQWSNVGGAQININTTDGKEGLNASYRMSYNTQTPTPSSNLNLTYGKNLSKSNSLFFNFNLRGDYQNMNGVLRLVNKQGNPVLDYNFNDKTNQITPSGVFVLSHFKNGITLKNTLFLVNQNTLTDRVTTGTHFDYSKDLHTTRRSPMSHTLLTEQIIFGINKDKWQFETIGGWSYVNSGENDRQQFVYLYDGNYQFNNVDRLDNHRFWSKNIENRIYLTGNGRYVGDKLTHEMGYSFMIMDNTFDYQQQYYDLSGVNDENTNINPVNPFNFINDGNTIELWVNNPASKVDGTTYINGGYYKADMPGDKLDIGIGSRFEYVNQLVKYRDQLSPVFVRYNRLNNFEILPFLDLKYKTNENIQYKLNSSVTTIRPRFREMTPFIYTEVFAGSKIQGNPNLKNSTVYSTDLTVEFYPKRNEVISLGVYGKVIDNPIERVNVATASGRLETYQNSLSSTVYGAEIDVKKKIGDFTLDYNMSFLKSNILISDSSQSSVVVTNFDRPLQGSSPLLSNFDVFYNINKTSNIGLTYNYVGKKLNSVGVFGMGDIYQKSQHQLNMVYNVDKKKYSFSFRVNNVLNAKYELSQNTDIGNVVTHSFRTGQNVSMSIKYKF